MRTIALISQKGGAGKTTLAIALAVTAERAGLTSVLVDLDPQASAAQWSDLRQAKTPVVTCAPAARLTSVLTAAQGAGADIAILDTPTPPRLRSPPPGPAISCLFHAAQRPLTWWRLGRVST